MNENETFNPTESYSLIRAMPSGPEKEHEKKIFHERRVRQKTEIAIVAALLIEEVMANPDIDQNVLKNMMLKNAPEMELSGPQKKLFNKMINAYTDRREQIRKLRKFSDDPNEIFKAKFGKIPQNNVKVIFGPIVTHFILSDADYATASRQSKNETGIVLKSAGQFLPIREDITISRASRSEFANESIRKHEETHALKHMLDSILGLYRFDRNNREKLLQLKKDFIATKNLNTKTYIVEKILRGYIDSNSDNIKDEIFANIREGGKQNIVEILTRSSYHLGGYDYSANDRKDLLEFIKANTNASDQALLGDSIKNFGSLNRACIKEAVDSVMVLAKTHKFTPEMILIFLNDVPLSLWKKEVAHLQNLTNK